VLRVKNLHTSQSILECPRARSLDQVCSYKVYNFLGYTWDLSCKQEQHGQFSTQALVSFKKYMPPPLPYFKVNICPLPLPHFASIIMDFSKAFDKVSHNLLINKLKSMA
jgi:hypothetical protein